jgi:hypothetical protein
LARGPEIELAGVCVVPGAEKCNVFRLEALACACGVLARDGRWKRPIREGLKERVAGSASAIEEEGVLERKDRWKARKEGVRILL